MRVWQDYPGTKELPDILFPIRVYRRETHWMKRWGTKQFIIKSGIYSICQQVGSRHVDDDKNDYYVAYAQPAGHNSRFLWHGARRKDTDKLYLYAQRDEQIELMKNNEMRLEAIEWFNPNLIDKILYDSIGYPMFEHTKSAKLWEI